MSRHPALLGAIVLAAASGKPVAAQARSKADQAARIEQDCGLAKGTIAVQGDKLRLRASPDEDGDAVDCALGRLQQPGPGERALARTDAAPVAHPPSLIAIGPAAEIDALAQAATADKWTITTRATASNGLTILQFEGGPTLTHAEASRLLARIKIRQFGDIAIGPAPRKLSDPERDPFDE